MCALNASPADFRFITSATVFAVRSHLFPFLPSCVLRLFSSLFSSLHSLASTSTSTPHGCASYFFRAIYFKRCLLLRLTFSGCFSSYTSPLSSFFLCCDHYHHPARPYFPTSLLSCCCSSSNGYPTLVPHMTTPLSPCLVSSRPSVCLTSSVDLYRRFICSA